MTGLDGISATLLIIIGSVLIGAVLGIIIMGVMHGTKWIQRLTLPYYDEADSISAELSKSLKSKTKMTEARAIREGLFAIALAIITGMVFSGFLNMIGHLSTPSG